MVCCFEHRRVSRESAAPFDEPAVDRPRDAAREVVRVEDDLLLLLPREPFHEPFDQRLAGAEVGAGGAFRQPGPAVDRAVGEAAHALFRHELDRGVGDEVFAHSCSLSLYSCSLQV
jgi:hypothetical protein